MELNIVVLKNKLFFLLISSAEHVYILLRF